MESLGADLLVIQECENPEYSTKVFAEWAGDGYLWYGKDKNKGIGIFPLGDISVERWLIEDGALELFLACRINRTIPLVAVWTKYANSPNFRYIGQFWKYLQLHKSRFAKELPIICGDLNSNVLWDEWDRWWNHSDVVRELEEIALYSLYHGYFNELQGDESQPTFYMQRKIDRPYHIDYVFAPEYLLSGAKLEVGCPQDWLKWSDHMPVVFDVEVSAGC